MRTRPSLIVSGVVSLALVVLGFWMVVAGWPMRTPAQVTLLDLAQLPMAGAVLVAIVEMTWARRLWLRSPRIFAGVFGPAAVALALGVMLVAVAYATSMRSYSGTGQLFIWVGVGLAFVYLAVDSLRREVTDPRTLLLEDLDATETPEGSDHLVSTWDDEDATDHTTEEPHMDPLTDAALAWRAQDPDPDTVRRLDELLAGAEAGDESARTELAAAFAGPLEFGTAGLRGPLGPGPARMNRVVVTQAAAGFGRWLLAAGLSRGRVIVGYDARYKSADFARDTAEVLAAQGFVPLLVVRPTPTPVVAFGIRRYECVAGIVVTASHNPATDNGYKVYLGDGSQIVPPTDTEIAGHIADVAARPIAELPRSEAYETLGDELVEAYVAHATTLLPESAPRRVNWVYTAMHGVGARVMEAVASAVGFPAPVVVEAQHDPDPAFPTVGFPNPEEPGAIDLALALARDHGVDVVVANDPDADRCAAASVVDGTWRMLTGDELGIVLADDALRRGVTGVYASSIVSSSLLRRLAEAYGQPYRSTLTGFKWIGRVQGLAFGYEEAIGYCCDPAAVPDKDGITAGLRLLALTAALRAEGLTLADRLDEIARTYGLHTTAQLSVRVKDLSLIGEAMARLRANPPVTLLGETVTVTDLLTGGDLPPTDGVRLEGETLRVVVRPSGTEPKLKAYLEVRETPEASQDVGAARTLAADRIARLRTEMSATLGLS